MRMAARSDPGTGNWGNRWQASSGRGPKGSHPGQDPRPHTEGARARPAPASQKPAQMVPKPELPPSSSQLFFDPQPKSAASESPIAAIRPSLAPTFGPERIVDCVTIWQFSSHSV